MLNLAPALRNQFFIVSFKGRTLIFEFLNLNAFNCLCFWQLQLHFSMSVSESVYLYPWLCPYLCSCPCPCPCSCPESCPLKTTMTNQWKHKHGLSSCPVSTAISLCISMSVSISICGFCQAHFNGQLSTPNCRRCPDKLSALKIAVFIVNVSTFNSFFRKN